MSLGRHFCPQENRRMTSESGKSCEISNKGKVHRMLQFIHQLYLRIKMAFRCQINHCLGKDMQASKAHTVHLKHSPTLTLTYASTHIHTLISNLNERKISITIKKGRRIIERHGGKQGEQ